MSAIHKYVLQISTNQIFLSIDALLNFEYRMFHTVFRAEKLIFWLKKVEKNCTLTLYRKTIGL